MLIFDWRLFMTVVLLADVIHSSEDSQNPNSMTSNTQIFRVDADTLTDAKPRIVGGETAKLKDFPWMAFFLYRTKTYAISCSATIISPSTILTNAHCVYMDPNQKNGRFTITAGNFKLKESDRFEQIVRVKEVIMHPSYDYDVLGHYDIAVLKLRKPLRINKRVQSVKLPKLTRAKSLFKRNNCVVTGYGYSSYPEARFPTVLQKAEVTILSKRLCSKLSPGYKFGKLLLCTNDIGRGVCFGDSGGSLVCYDKKDTAYQVGVTSLTDDCQGGSIYVSVPRMLKWIQKYL